MNGKGKEKESKKKKCAGKKKERSSRPGLKLRIAARRRPTKNNYYLRVGKHHQIASCHETDWYGGREGEND